MGSRHLASTQPILRGHHREVQEMRRFSRALEIHGSYVRKRVFVMWHWSRHTSFPGRSSDRPPDRAVARRRYGYLS